MNLSVRIPPAANVKPTELRGRLGVSGLDWSGTVRPSAAGRARQPGPPAPASERCAQNSREERRPAVWGAELRGPSPFAPVGVQ